MSNKMNHTAKLVNATLKWKVRGGKQQQQQHQLQTTTINGGHHHNYHHQQQLANHLADFESGYRSLLAEQHHSSGSFSGGGGGYVEVQPVDCQVCSIKQSPYRILKAAEAGNLEVFIKLYRQNNARLKFTDKYGKRGE